MAKKYSRKRSRNIRSNRRSKNRSSNRSRRVSKKHIRKIKLRSRKNKVLRSRKRSIRGGADDADDAPAPWYAWQWLNPADTGSSEPEPAKSKKEISLRRVNDYEQYLRGAEDDEASGEWETSLKHAQDQAFEYLDPKSAKAAIREVIAETNIRMKDAKNAESMEHLKIVLKGWGSALITANDREDAKKALDPRENDNY